MFGVAAVTHIILTIPPAAAQAVNLPYWPTVAAVLVLVAMLQGPCAHQRIFLAYIPYDVVRADGPRWV